ncbi:MAG: aldo/keto reductase [Burkholderiaceae bacterium]
MKRMTLRRDLLRVAAGVASLPVLAMGQGAPASVPGPGVTRPLPDGGGRLPVIGMGTWITFNVGGDAQAIASRAEVMRAFFARGGGMVDSSPMYGSSEAVVGKCLEMLGQPAELFAATKTWSSSVAEGREQWQQSRRLWGLDRFQLLQVHNLLAWREQLAWLADEKAAGRVRFVGVTTSHGRRHDDLERIMRDSPIDFVQLTYNAIDRAAEARLLPLAAERGIAVVANRPFRRGWLPRRLSGVALPGWAADIGCAHWAQVLLKWIVANPVITCAIPATSRVDHMIQNMAAGLGPLPDAQLRARIGRVVAELV